MDFVFPIIDSLSALTVFGGALFVVLAGFLIVELGLRRHTMVLSWVSKRGLLLMFIVALVATAGSLFFSEVAGFAPCRACWFQRIFMYPQVVLLGIALWRKDRGIAFSILALSVIGAYLAGDHYILQLREVLTGTTEGNVPCDASGISCAKAEFFHYGYVTIPMMALTAFALNTLGSLTIIRRK